MTPTEEQILAAFSRWQQAHREAEATYETAFLGTSVTGKTTVERYYAALEAEKWALRELERLRDET